MIRINLLSEGRRPVVARKRARLGMEGVDPSGPILIAGIAIGLIVVGIWWFLLNGKLNAVDEEVRRAEREVEELRPIIEEVEAFKAKQAELERKIDVIKNLKKNQKGPVEIMDKVSRALPDLLWLNRMTVRGTSVDITGQALNTNAIAAFIENLDKVPEFEEPDTQDVSKSGPGYTFKLSFRYQLLDPEGEQDESAA